MVIETIGIPAGNVVFNIISYHVAIAIIADYMIMIACLPAKSYPIPSGKTCHGLLIATYNNSQCCAESRSLFTRF